MFGYALLRASYSGAIRRQGPQNSAQKSTTAGLNLAIKIFHFVVPLTLYQDFAGNVRANQY